jgi:hypothetical protein
VLWPGFVSHFAQSAGTSSANGGLKYLPVSKVQIRWQLRAAFDVVARYLILSGDRDLTEGYMLGLVPPVVIQKEGPIGVSSNPALLMHHAPRIGRPWTLPRSPVDAIEDRDARLSAIAEAYLDWDVRLLAGTVCWFSVLFDRLLEAARTRGRRVESVRDIWPNLRGMITGGLHPEPYRRMLETRLGSSPTLLDHYNCTEAGLIACTDRRDADDMLFVPDRGVFYEFVPRAEHGQPDARRLPIWEVDVGEEYAVVLSTPSGLIAYILGDFVRFTSLFPHRMIVTGRIGGGLSPTHELTAESTIEAAVHRASQETGAVIVELAAAAEIGVDGSPKSRYLVYVELDGPFDDVARFERELDEALCSMNRIYAFHRTGDVMLLAPKMIALPRGSAERFMRALGLSSVQQKFPHTLDDARRQLLEDVAGIVRSR